MDGIRRQTADADELLDFSDSDSGSSCSDRIEIAGSLAVHQVSPLIALPGLHKCEIGCQAALEDIHPAAEVARLFPLGHKSAISSGSEERGDPGAARAHAL